MIELPLAYIQECLDYSPETGVLTWKKRPSHHFSTQMVERRFNNIYAGKPAGGRVANGYLMLPFKNESGKRQMLYAHRIAYALHFGYFPMGEIDHINGIRSDNRIANLRVAERLQNAANSIFKVQNQRGTRQMKSGQWTAQISFQGRNVYLGSYGSEAEAYAAFCGAAILSRKEFAQLTHER